MLGKRDSSTFKCLRSGLPRPVSPSTGQESHEAKGMCLLGTPPTPPSYRLNPSSLVWLFLSFSLSSNRSARKLLPIYAPWCPRFGLEKPVCQEAGVWELWLEFMLEAGASVHVCLGTLVVWCRKELRCKKQGARRLAVGHNILASISEESENSTIQTWPSKSLWTQLMKTGRYY